MPTEKKYLGDFTNGGGDFDTAPFALGPNKIVNMENCRLGTTDAGETGTIESIGSTFLLSNPYLPAGNNIYLGGASDDPNNRIVYGIWNDQGNHGIFCYNLNVELFYQVLLNADVVGGLNLDRFHLITARVINSLFYWMDDGFNPPRKINIDAGLEMYFDPNNPLPGYVPDTTTPAIQELVGTTLSEYYELPTTPVPSYQSGKLTLNFQRQGHGAHGVPTLIPLIITPSGWSSYPQTNGYQQIVSNAINNYFTVTNPSGGNASSLGVVNGNPGLSININWDWNTGDSTFAPLNQITLLFNDFIRTDGQPTNPYISPLSQSAISWIKRQPGVPPNQVKILETPAPLNIFIGEQATLYAYRYAYRDFEISTLSGQSTLADFNEQVPPPTTTSLNVPNMSLVTRGYLATNFLLPTAPTPAYGPGVLAKITRVGTSGPNAVATDIPIPLDWTGYPATRSYTRVIVEGINSYFLNLPGSDNPGILSAGNYPATVGPDTYKWYISYRAPTFPTLNIIETWDWGLGDSSFPPTVEANLTLYVETPAPSKQFTAIDVSIPLGEQIDQDVLQVDLICVYLLSNTYSIINSWRKYIAAEAEAIRQHNAGTTPLTYTFRNNQAAIAIGNAYAVKPFDSLPVSARTFEIAKNFAYMSNYLLGYNSINRITSLSVSFVLTKIGTPVGTTINGEWYLFEFFNSPRTTVYHVYIMQTTQSITPQPPSSVYYYTTAGATPPFPGTISTGIIFLGTTLSQVMQYYINQAGDIAPGNIGSLVDQNTASALLLQNQTLNFGVLSKAFKQNCPYQVSLSFMDNAGRKGGIITNTTLLLNIPNTGFSNNQYVTFLTWFLSNANSLTEIPVEAYYYSINITKCLKTRFFVDSIGFVTYATLNAENVYSVTALVYSTDYAGVAIDLSFLISQGMGYTYTPGDICEFYLAGVSYSLAVIGQSGRYVILQLANVGNQLGAASLASYCLYTPYAQPVIGGQSQTEPHYEVGQIFPISNPGTPQRQYSVTTGTIQGDIFIFQRENFSIPYVSEAMSPNDKLYKYWFTDAGRTNFLDFIGQTKNPDSVCFSDAYVVGSQNNGLSSFETLNVKPLYIEGTPVRKLQLAGKVAGQEGSVMLAICENETFSLYLSEAQLVGAVENVTLAQAVDIIGTVNTLQKSFGTINPESVTQFKGNVMWFDAKSDKWIQYSPNGLFPISNYKATRLWKQFSDTYKSLTQEEIVAMGSQPFVFSCVDPHHWELLCSIPQVLQTPPKGYLPDYPDMIYPFDIWDGQAKCIVFKLNADPNWWMGAFNIPAEGFITVQNNVYPFKNGQMYQLNSEESYGNLFGTQYKSRVMFVANQLPSKPKVYNAIGVEANMRPSLTYFRTEPTLTETEEYDLWEQASDLMDFSFKVKEGQLYATILRNKLVPTAYGLNLTGLLTAEKIRALTLKILIEFSATNFPVELRFIDLEYDVSRGHRLE